MKNHWFLLCFKRSQGSDRLTEAAALFLSPAKSGVKHMKKVKNLTNPKSSGRIHAGTPLFSMISLYKSSRRKHSPPGAAGGGRRVAGGWAGWRPI